MGDIGKAEEKSKVEACRSAEMQENGSCVRLSSCHTVNRDK